MRQPHPRLVRTIYRSLLRASHNGRYPEVFGRYGAAVLARQQQQQQQQQLFSFNIKIKKIVDDGSNSCSSEEENTTSMMMVAGDLPQTPKQVRNHLKQWFRKDFTTASARIEEEQETAATMEGYEGGKGMLFPVLQELLESPLEIVRQTNQSEAMMNVMEDAPIASLPIVDSNQVIAIPGERIQTIFHERRHTNGLLPLVLASESKLFLLRPSPTSTTATLMKLIHMRPVVVRSSAASSANDQSESGGTNNNNGKDEGKATSSTNSSTKGTAGASVICLAGPKVQINQEEPVDSKALMEYIWQKYGGSLSSSSSSDGDNNDANIHRNHKDNHKGKRRKPLSPNDELEEFARQLDLISKQRQQQQQQQQQLESIPPMAFASEYCRQYDDDNYDDNDMEAFAAVTEEEEEDVDLLKTQNNPALLFATNSSSSSNNNNQEETTIPLLRQRILYLLEGVLALQQREFLSTMITTGYGLPPLDGESFSYWALKFVLPTHHLDTRSFWLYRCNSTTMRLQCVLEILQAIVDSTTTASSSPMPEEEEEKSQTKDKLDRMTVKRQQQRAADTISNKDNNDNSRKTIRGKETRKQDWPSM